MAGRPGPPPNVHPLRNKALLKAYSPLVSLNKALLSPYSWGGTLGGAPVDQSWFHGIVVQQKYLNIQLIQLATLANQNLYFSQQKSQISKNIKSPLCELVPSRCRSHLWCWLRYQLRWLLHRLRHLWSLLGCRLWYWMWSSSCLHLNLAHWTMQDLEAPGFGNAAYPNHPSISLRH